MTPRGDRLDPVRLSPPRPATLVRAGLVALLLSVAAALLYLDPGPANGVAPPAPRSTRPVPPAGLVGVPVRLADPAALAVVRPGDRVDLLAVPVEPGGAATILAARVLVLSTATAPDAPVLYLALGEAEARATAAAGPDIRFAVIVRGP